VFILFYLFIFYFPGIQNFFQNDCFNFNVIYREAIFRFSQQLFNATGKITDKLLKTAENDILIFNAFLSP